jgi:hypothetical protein
VTACPVRGPQKQYEKEKTMTKLGFIVTTAATLVALAVPAQAQDYDPIEAWQATTVQMDIGKMVIVRIGVQEWSTEEERKAMLNAFSEGGSQALQEFLKNQPEKGFVKFPNTTAYQMRYAYQTEHDGKRYVVMATDRPVGSIARREGADTWQYNISLLSLELDDKGKGKGTLVAGAEIVFDEETKKIKIGHVGTQPVRFTSVKKIKIKDKG